ncbi:hypothetical protein EW145_g1513 [Phellinidium pouzarii]|uniref:Uncharacterized protein n=1 Tax=Phellinidium pouzarii TaxID=167371 RepID=A0A4S4LFZ6_9AGAM|nr:hypothetical protein EW145_g1513 [Phellinidium pouzarii]
MMKWTTRKGLHRDRDQAVPVDVQDIPQSVDHRRMYSADSLSPSMSIFPDRPGRPSTPIMNTSDALLITHDIEALLKEDEVVRSQSREIELDNAAFIHDVSPPLGFAGPFVGLPAPPRGPRKTLREQGLRQRPGLSERGHLPTLSMGVVMDNSMDIQRSSNASCAVPSPSDSLPPSILKDVPIESASSLGTDVMNASNMHRTSSRLEEKRSQSPEFGPKRAQYSSDSHVGATPGVDSRLHGKYIPAASSTNSNVDDLAGRVSSSCSAASSTFKSTKIATQLPTRPLLSRVPTSSRDSDFSYSSVSSHDPASTIHESRISISSTIYPSSTCNTSPSPIPWVHYSHQLEGNRSSLCYSEVDQASFEDRSCSIPDTLGHETGAPRRLASPMPERLHSYDSPRMDIFDNSFLPRRPLSASSDVSRRSSPGLKPALPTAPKPDFRRPRSVQPTLNATMASKPPSPSSSPKFSGRIPYHLLTSLSRSDPGHMDSLPPTTNHLSPQDRADLIRKTRKLTQVLGQTPSPLTGPEEDYPISNNCLIPIMAPRKLHPRGALSVSDASIISGTLRSPQDQHLSVVSVEQTDSLSPITFRSSNFVHENDSDDSASPFESPAAQTPMSSRKRNGDVTTRSPTIIDASDSFMELSDTDAHGVMSFPSTHSLINSMSDTQKTEEERRRKRERLAKLHRFLGSRVPAELILGPHEIGAPLPALDPNHVDSGYTLSDGETSSSARLWMRGKRRNSLASSDPLERLADTERVKEHMTEKEKAIVVKRALKMERMFGEQPPQDLFNSDRSRSAQHKSRKFGQSNSVTTKSAPSSPVSGNISKSVHRKGKQSKHSTSSRPGTTESRRGLLGSSGGASGDFGEHELGNDGSSDLYSHYRSSLISLANIVDNDDRRSLVELHEYINEDLSKGHRDNDEWDTKSSVRSERRRSLPLRSSHTSLASQFTYVEAKAEITPFEVRRRRAAKLSHFFGVSYRNLFGEVLDSIETGVREDEGKGTLNADEAKVLLAQLTKLKKRRDELS